VTFQIEMQWSWWWSTMSIIFGRTWIYSYWSCFGRRRCWSS